LVSCWRLLIFDSQGGFFDVHGYVAPESNLLFPKDMGGIGQCFEIKRAADKHIWAFHFRIRCLYCLGLKVCFPSFAKPQISVTSRINGKGRDGQPYALEKLPVGLTLVPFFGRDGRHAANGLT